MIETFFDILLIVIGVVVGLILAAYLDSYIVSTEPDYTEGDTYSDYLRATKAEEDDQ
jgi:hypothetical protein